MRAIVGVKTRLLLWLLASVLAGTAFSTDIATLRNGFSIRHDSREYRGAITRLYLDSNPSNYVDVATADIISIDKDDSPPASAKKVGPAMAPVLSLNSAIASASTQTQVDPDLISSIIRAESGFNIHAVSPKGAQGLMQLMPGTASKLGVKNAFDPSANVEAGTRYFNQLLESYHNDMAKALAAYNAGPQRVAQYHGIPPYHETRLYVAKVIRDFNRKKLAQKKASASKAKSTAEKRASAHSPTPGS